MAEPQNSGSSLLLAVKLHHCQVLLHIYECDVNPGIPETVKILPVMAEADNSLLADVLILLTGAIAQRVD